MSAAAADYFLAARPIPSQFSVPARGSALYAFIYARQTDSLGAAFSQASRFARWMTLPDSGPAGVARLTGDQWPSIRASLDEGRPTSLGLVLVGPNRPGALWQNHQVLAYAYTTRPDAQVDVHIYDPNFPSTDDAVLRLTLRARIADGPIRAFGIAIPDPYLAVHVERIVPRRSRTPVRGVFLMPYSPKPPPEGL
ncbi:MAG: hypothetical protein KF745_05445 [Phycisphaeraceae bacterium]|nr:hypothetical protein [Phycisphaeraceae bacterium]